MKNENNNIRFAHCHHDFIDGRHPYSGSNPARFRRYVMYQTLAERRRLARYLSKQDFRFNPAHHSDCPYLQRLILISLIVLVIAS